MRVRRPGEREYVRRVCSGTIARRTGSSCGSGRRPLSGHDPCEFPAAAGRGSGSIAGEKVLPERR